MDRLEHLLAAVAPALFALAYAVLKTRIDWRNEALWAAFLLGGLGAIILAPIEVAFSLGVDSAAWAPVLKAGMTAIFMAAIPEETVKYLILIGAAEPHVDARRRQDLIALAVAVSLGFATAENLAYVLVPPNWQFVAAARAFTAVPSHAGNGLVMGALLTTARIAPGKRLLWAALALVVPICMHATYDFPLLALKGASRGSAILSSLALLWPLIMLLETVAAVWLCNRILPAAREADRRSGRDLQQGASTPYLILTGILAACASLAVILVLAIVAAHAKGAAPVMLAAALCIVPSILAIDLIRTGISERRGRRFSYQGQRSPARQGHWRRQSPRDFA